MADRSDEGAYEGDLWEGLKLRMDDRQAAYRRSWLRAPPLLILKFRRETRRPE